MEAGEERCARRTARRRAATPARTRSPNSARPASRPVAVMCVSRSVAPGRSRCRRSIERRRSARFAQRHRVHPDHVAREPRCGLAVYAEALADALAIARLAAAAPPEPQRKQRQREPPQQRVERARIVAVSSAASRASARRRARRDRRPATGSMPRAAEIPRVRARRSRRRHARGSVARRAPTVGVPSAAARCVSPVSTPTASSARARIVASIGQRQPRRHDRARRCRRRDARCAPAPAALPQGSIVAKPARAKCSISTRQCASGHSLSARDVACSTTTNGRAGRSGAVGGWDEVPARRAVERVAQRRRGEHATARRRSAMRAATR